ncbi:MAG: DUF420 domain-containing protein, partial [Armatimonadetes bacterium]|nr:DUF420 domain-containing protein [Armatimonadota bacterium]
KTLMMTVSAILGFAVILFEIEMRLSGWKHLAEKSPYYETYVPLSLGIHLFFSISTSVALLSTVVLALKNFSKRPKPNAHSQLHKKLGWISTLGLVGTSITGWIFYYLAFVAD